MKNARVSPRWVDYMHPANPHGLRFIEGDDHADGDAGQGKPTGSDDADKPLGEGGVKALQAERDARKALEQQVAQMQQSQQQQMAAIAQAFGVKPPASDDDGTQLISTLQEQVAEMQRTNLLATVAREHEITAADDIALISEAKSEDGMRRIAARLQAATATNDAPGTPKPDRTQGGTGDHVQPEAQPGVPRMAAAIEAELQTTR